MSRRIKRAIESDRPELGWVPENYSKPHSVDDPKRGKNKKGKKQTKKQN